MADGHVVFRSAVDPRRAEHAFGAAGAALAAVAQALCQSLADQWQKNPSADWVPPYGGAEFSVSAFTASSINAELDFSLRQRSSLHTLLSAYEIPAMGKPASITRRVQSIVRGSVRNRHLAPRFNRLLQLGDQAELKVDFLGQNFACYFLQASPTLRGIEASAERAYGKLFELQALRRFAGSRPDAVGLFEDERPKAFELVVVGSREHEVQRRVIAQIEAIADSRDVRMRDLCSADEAAEHVADMERRAA